MKASVHSPLDLGRRSVSPYKIPHRCNKILLREIVVVVIFDNVHVGLPAAVPLFKNMPSSQPDKDLNCRSKRATRPGGSCQTRGDTSRKIPSSEPAHNNKVNFEHVPKILKLVITLKVNHPSLRIVNFSDVVPVRNRDRN